MDFSLTEQFPATVTGGRFYHVISMLSMIQIKKPRNAGLSF